LTVAAAIEEGGGALPADRRMLFCVGAQKSGTSWLSKYLAAHPDCHFCPFDKEVHYFDALHFGAAPQIKRVSKMLRRQAAQARAAAQEPEKFEAVMERLSRHADWLEIYRPGAAGLSAYVDGLMRGAGQARWLCDFTPAYALLPGRLLRDMARFGNGAKFVFLMRDPVERLWSQLRMEVRFNGARPDMVGVRARQKLEKLVAGEGPALTRRSDYRRTVEVMDRALPGDDVLYAFYEDLFTQPEADRICDFLGIARQPGSFDVVFKGIEADLPDTLRAGARRLLDDQYAFVRARFGDAAPAGWAWDGPR
jgi:hypothetical protein